MFRRVIVHHHHLAATSRAPLDHVCEYLQHAFNTDPFVFDGEAGWNWGEASSSSWHLNVTQDNSLTLMNDWEGVPTGTNYLITLSCEEAEAPHLLSRLTGELEAVLKAKVQSVKNPRPPQEWRKWQRFNPPSRWFLPLAWTLFIGLVAALFLVLRSCTT